MKNNLYDSYDQLITKCLPNYYFLLGLVAEAIGNITNIIDLGCGTGNLANIIFQTLPSVEIRGIDTSAEFMEIAKSKNTDYLFMPVLSNALDYAFGKCNQDCIISSFTIHHFEDRKKIKLFRKIFHSLRNGGTFINLDMVRPRNYQQAVSIFLTEMKKAGLSAEFIETEKKEMAKRDQPVSLKKQKKWLEKIGFKFELLYNNGLFAIYICQKPLVKG